MNSNDYIIRSEEKADYREVENLVRESTCCGMTRPL